MDSQNTKKKAPRIIQDYSLSMTVFTKDPLLNQYGVTPDKLLENDNVLKAILYKYGLDVDKPFTYTVCQHRNTFGKVVTAPLFAGVERRDYGWLYIKRNINKLYESYKSGVQIETYNSAA